jgi:hypothetical protein
MAKKVFQGGRLTNFNRRLDKLKENKSTFSVVSGGMTKKILYKNDDDTIRSKEVFFGYKGNNNLKGAYMVNLVKKEIDEYIQEGYPIPENKINPTLVLYNLSMIKKLTEEDPKRDVCCIDINSCYFQTAYNLGYITQETFKKGWESRKVNKIGFLASIGSLNKKNLISEYKNGNLVNQYYDMETYNKYSPFYWAIINEVFRLMSDIAVNLKDDFFMWLTDCAYINKDRKEEVERYLEANNYEHKNFVAEFVKFDGRKVYWYDHSKGVEKHIHIHKRCGFDPSTLTD